MAHLQQHRGAERSWGLWNLPALMGVFCFVHGPLSDLPQGSWPGVLKLYTSLYCSQDYNSHETSDLVWLGTPDPSCLEQYPIPPMFTEHPIHFPNVAGISDTKKKLQTLLSSPFGSMPWSYSPPGHYIKHDLWEGVVSWVTLNPMCCSMKASPALVSGSDYRQDFHERRGPGQISPPKGLQLTVISWRTVCTNYVGQRLSWYSLSASEHNFAFQSDCKLLIVKGTWHCALIRHKVENPETIVVNSLVKAIGITGPSTMRNVDVCWRVEQREGCLSNHNPEALKEEPVFPSKTTWDSFSPTQISLWQTHKTTDACYAELQFHFKKFRCYQRPNSAPVESWDTTRHHRSELLS